MEETKKNSWCTSLNKVMPYILNDSVDNMYQENVQNDIKMFKKEYGDELIDIGDHYYITYNPNNCYGHYYSLVVCPNFFKEKIWTLKRISKFILERENDDLIYLDDFIEEMKFRFTHIFSEYEWKSWHNTPIKKE